MQSIDLYEISSGYCNYLEFKICEFIKILYVHCMGMKNELTFM